MATVISHLNPAAIGHGNAMAELDLLLQDLYVANNEESRLIEKEKQYIQALEGSIQERQKLIQNFQKETSKADKDIKFAHQQFKNNRTNCESLKSQYSVLQQHQNNLYKKQDDVNNKWKVKRSELSKRVDQYEGTWQTYQAKYEENELAMQLLDLESQVTQVNNRIVNATQTVEQLQHSIMNLQQLDSNKNQMFKSLNEWVIKIAEIKHATNTYNKQIGNKESECDKLRQKGQNLKLQESQLCQRLDEVQKAKQDQDIRRAKLIEAEKQKCAEQAPSRHGTIPAQTSQGKTAHRYITPNAEKVPMQQPITTSRSSPVVVGNHSSRSNTAPIQLGIPQQKAPPFIQMPVLSSPARPQAKPANTSLGVDRGVKLSTVPSHFTLQYPSTPRQLTAPSQINTVPVRRSPPQINVSHATSSTSGSPNITTPQGNHGNGSKIAERPGMDQMQHQQQAPRMIERQDQMQQQRQSPRMVERPDQMQNQQSPRMVKRQDQMPQHQQSQRQDPGLGEQQQGMQGAGQMTMDHSMAYDIPLPPDDDEVLNTNVQTPSRESIPSNPSTPNNTFNFDGYRQEIEAIKMTSPGFVFPSRPMYSAGSVQQTDPNASEAMESASSSAGNFQESPFFSSLFSGNAFASEKETNQSNVSQMFSSPKAPNNSPQSAGKGNSNNLEKSQAREDTGGFMMPPSDSMRMNFNNPSDMFGPSSPMPAPSSGAFSLFGSSNDAASAVDGNSSGGFSFSFGGGPDSPSVGTASSQPFSLF